MLKFLIIPLVLFSFMPLAFAQNTTAIDTYFSNLNYIFGDTNSVNVFFPISLILLVIVFTGYGLTHQTDRLSSVFTIGAVPVCIILSLMFIAPVSFDFTTNNITVNVISDPEDNVFTDIKNSTNTIQVIPDDQQFRLIFSSFFLLFAIFNGFLTILIMTGKII